MTDKISRRAFTGGAIAAGAAAAFYAPGMSPLGSNDRVRLGFIGVGHRGDDLLDTFRAQKDAEIVALCDVYEPYLDLARAKLDGRVQCFRDYRRLLEQKYVDAVVIATPDHWHALQFVAACRAGKDVYVEKPLSLTIAEGQKMAAVAAETGRVVQVGLQRRSAPFVREAVELIRNGGIGRVTVAKCYHLQNEFPQGIGRPADSEPPAGLDWEMWLGPAPKVAFNANRCLYKFRWFWDYSGGQLTNFGTHYLDVIQWALGHDAPRRVFVAGGRLAVEDNREIPDTLEAIWEYGDGTLVTFSQVNANAAAGNARGWELEFRGTKGTLLMQHDQGYVVLPEKNRVRELPALSPGRRREDAIQTRAVRPARQSLAVKGKVETADHVRNFLDCVKSRQPTNCPATVGHESTRATLLAKIALRLGRQVVWDAQGQCVAGDEEASRLLSYSYRHPWRLV